MDTEANRIPEQTVVKEEEVDAKRQEVLHMLARMLFPVPYEKVSILVTREIGKQITTEDRQMSPDSRLDTTKLTPELLSLVDAFADFLDALYAKTPIARQPGESYTHALKVFVKNWYEEQGKEKPQLKKD